MLRRVVWWKLTEVSEMLYASIIRAIIVLPMIALMMEAGSTSETSINFHQTTRRNIPEDSHLHIRRVDNLKSHQL
jgi:hypothetical protein